MEMMEIKRRSFLPFLLFAAVLGIAGCDGYYTAYPGYGPNYGPAPYYGGGYPATVNVAVYDRPYYRGPGYWSGNVYYVWKPRHWVWRNGQKLWIRGHYVVRRY